MSTAPVLVIGSTGKVGSRVVQRLTELGHPVRQGSRRSTPAFDWQQRDTWAAALDGVEVAYVSYFPDLAIASALDDMTALTEAARNAGLRKLVLLSGRGEANAQAAEEIVRNSGLAFTLVRAAWFNQNFSEGHLLPSVLDGTIAMPAGDVREAFVDADDIADVATAALIDPRHDGELYEITGSRLMTFNEAAAEIAAASGRPVQYLPISFDDFRAGLAAEAGIEIADLMTAICRETLDGRNAHLGDGVQRALGRAPRDFSAFCRAVAPAWSAAA